SVRQSVDQLAAQLAAGQQQVVDNIAKLHADEQKILQKLTATPQKLPATPQKLSGTPPGATAAPARKPPPVTAPPSPSESPSPSPKAPGGQRRAAPALAGASQRHDVVAGRIHGSVDQRCQRLEGVQHFARAIEA